MTTGYKDNSTILTFSYSIGLFLDFNLSFTKQVSEVLFSP